MGTLLARNQEIARRCRDLTPFTPEVKRIIFDGNKAVIMAGVSPGTTRPVKVTWRQGHGDNEWVNHPSGGRKPFLMVGYKQAGRGPARAPKGEESRIVAGCEISVRAGVGLLAFTKSWPSLGPIAEYIEFGTRYTPARPFIEYRKIDLEMIGKGLQQYVIKPTGFFGRLFGR